MTDHANLFLLTFLIGGCAIFLTVILAPFIGVGVMRRIREDRIEAERTELDNDQPPRDRGIRM
jgi:hypothetical protein